MLTRSVTDCPAGAGAHWNEHLNSKGGILWASTTVQGSAALCGPYRVANRRHLCPAPASAAKPPS